MSSETPMVQIEHLTKRYGEFTALDDLSLSVPAGQILGLIGPNGAGKTTTIKIMVGLSRPTGGTVRIGGVDCALDSSRIKRMVGYMPDKFGSYDNMRVREYLDFFGAAFYIPRKKRIQRIAEVMEITNTAHMRDKFVESLSHGMQQRVGITRTLLHDPQVLILDEPANGLDPQARIEMRDLLIRLAHSGKTLLVTSHILPELSRICDRVAIMTHGRLRAYGTVEEIGRQVSQQRAVEVQLTRREQIAQAGVILRRALEPASEVVESPAESTVRFRTDRSETLLGEILAQLIGGGIGVSQFREVQTDLEEAFMSFARPAETSHSGSAARPAAIAQGGTRG